jgi:hypothetical protein
VSTSTGRDDPGSTYETPPSTRDDPAAACIQCDVIYDCPNSSLGDGFSLSSSDGTCSPSLVDSICNGTLLGTGPCNALSGGGFTCGDVTCTPESQSQPGGNNGEDAGVGTPGTAG